MSENLAENVKVSSKIKSVAKLYSPDVECEHREAIYCGTLLDYEANSLGNAVTASLKVELLLDPVLARLVWRELNKSDAFQRGLVSWIFGNWILKNCGNNLNHNGDFKDNIASKSNICQVCVTNRRKRKLQRYELIIKIRLLPPNPLSAELDVQWCYKLYPLLLEQAQLQVLMSWLSTLGGAYSALGEYFIHHSEKAGHISVQQLQIARQLGDPVMVAQCKVFFAMSLVQRGRLRQAAKIVREQYSFALSSNCKDLKLVATCKAVWVKIQFVKKQHQVMKENLNRDGGRASQSRMKSLSCRN